MDLLTTHRPTYPYYTIATVRCIANTARYSNDYTDDCWTTCTTTIDDGSEANIRARPRYTTSVCFDLTVKTTQNKLWLADQARNHTHTKMARSRISILSQPATLISALLLTCAHAAPQTEYISGSFQAAVWAQSSGQNLSPAVQAQCPAGYPNGCSSIQEPD